MALCSVKPDMVAFLPLDLSAPRGARQQVADVDSPSPDLRDAVTLLASELVSRAVLQREALSRDAVELRVWMPLDVVRVELHAPVELNISVPETGHGEYDLMLLDQIADRWSVETGPTCTCVWFEIDRGPPGGTW
jgi:hypothetical protein